MNIKDLKATSMLSSELFIDVFNNPNVEEIKFNPEWMGATEYLNRATTVAEVPYGDIRKFVDSYNRKCLLISTGNASICVFERYTGRSDILVANFPDSMNSVKNAAMAHSALEDKSLFILFIVLQQIVTKERSPILAYSILQDRLFCKTRENEEYYMPFGTGEIHLPVKDGVVVLSSEQGLRPYIKSNTSSMLKGVKYLDHAQLSSIVNAFNNIPYVITNKHMVNLNQY